MLGEELRPGLWRWTGRYPEWKGGTERRAEIVEIRGFGQPACGTGVEAAALFAVTEQRVADDQSLGSRLPEKSFAARARFQGDQAGGKLVADLEDALDFPVELILPSHGAPVLSEAKAQLAEVTTPAAPVPSDTGWPDRATHTTSP